MFPLLTFLKFLRSTNLKIMYVIKRYKITRTKIIKKTVFNFKKFIMQISDNNMNNLSKNFFLNLNKIDGVIFINVKIVNKSRISR